MRKRLGKEIALLCLPVLLVGGMGWLVKAAWRPQPIRPVDIFRLKVEMFAADDVQIDFTMEWKPSLLDRRTEFPVHARSWLLDADGKLVAKQNGCEFERSRISYEEVVKNQWYIHPYLENIDSKVSEFKEPLTYQGVATIGNSLPLEWSFRVPTSTYSETPRASTFPFKNRMNSQCGTGAKQ